MTPTEIIAGLRRIYRASMDASLAAKAEANVFRDEYIAACEEHPASQEAHERALELYPRVVGAEHDAQKCRKDAALLREALQLIKSMDDRDDSKSR